MDTAPATLETEIELSDQPFCRRCGNTGLIISVEALCIRKDNPLFGMPPDYEQTGALITLKCKCGASAQAKRGYGDLF